MNSFNFLLQLLEGENPPDLATQMETLPKPAVEIKQELLEMQTFNQSKQLTDLESKEQMLNQGTNANGDATGNSSAFNENFDISKDVALVSSIKAKLERAGLLTTAKDQDKVFQLERLAEILQIGLKDKLAAAEASFNNERQRSLAIVGQMRQAPDVDTLFRATVTEVRQHLQVDRALIYSFQHQDSGVVLAESMVGGYTPSLGKTLAARIFEFGDEPYQQQQMVALEDIYQASLSPYQLQLLQQFQVKASLSLPIALEGQVWGLLVVQQCSSSRQWKETEISLLCQIVSELTWKLQLEELRVQLQRQAEQEKVLAKVIEKIQRSPDINVIFRTATQEVRHLLKADRVVIYRFNPDWSGEFVAESVAAAWGSVLAEQEEEPILKADQTTSERCTLKNLAVYSTSDADTYLKETRGGGYARGERFKRVDDVYLAGFSSCYIETLEKYQARAYVIVPVFQDTKLWGLLAAYQNSGPRCWEDSEVNLMLQLSTPLGIALQQAEVRTQLQAKVEQIAIAAERERTVTRIIDRLRQSLDINSIFRTTTQELRHLLKADRVLLYRFNPDWSGEFVAESVAPGWLALLQEQEKDTSLKGTKINSVRCSLEHVAVPFTSNADTYIKETRGGIYARGEGFLRVDDVYLADFSPCYIETLEKYQARAYLNVPIFQGDKIWGLMAAYQNSGPRRWEEWEVEIMLQVRDPLGIALQQAESLQQIRASSEKLNVAAAREQAVTRITSRLLRSLDIEAIFKITTQEIRQMLQAERVALYKFKPDWSGEFVAESVGSGWSRLMDTMPVIADSNLQETQGGRYRNNQTLAVNDIYTVGHSPCHIELLEEMEARAYIIVPVFVNQQLWGLLGAYQNSGPRVWEEGEVNLLVQVATQLGIAWQQRKYLEQLQTQSEQLAAAAEREKAAKEQLQARAVQLLVAVRPALNGDLTVRAPITDDEMGTIADAYNNTLQSLRKIVIQLQEASSKVAQTSQSSESDLSGLATLAQHQFQSLNRGLEQIQAMVNSTTAVASDAQKVELAVQRTNHTVREGDAAMNRTVDGILAIRETVAQTSKLMKRLSNSSQKISKVVNLISNFTTQTQLLALNASIEATRAGEYGRGFAVVADEVRALARQSAAATTEIAKLVQEIQDATESVSTAMATGTHQVVEGTNLVNLTRQNLNAIVEATAQISKLVEGITGATQSQTTQSQSVTQTMTEVATIANKTSLDSIELSASFKELLKMAQELQASVNQFKVN